MAPLGAPEVALGHAHAAIGHWDVAYVHQPRYLAAIIQLILIGADEVLADNDVQRQTVSSKADAAKDDRAGVP
jgi:hypothetical protein